MRSPVARRRHCRGAKLTHRRLALSQGGRFWLERPGQAYLRVFVMFVQRSPERSSTCDQRIDLDLAQYPVAHQRFGNPADCGRLPATQVVRTSRFGVNATMSPCAPAISVPRWSFDSQKPCWHKRCGAKRLVEGNSPERDCIFDGRCQVEVSAGKRAVFRYQSAAPAGESRLPMSSK